MSTAGESGHEFWVLLTDPADETTLYGPPDAAGKRVVFVFTRPAYARPLTHGPGGLVAAVARVTAPSLAAVLLELARRGRTHVVLDPGRGPPGDPNGTTVGITDLVVRLAALPAPGPAVQCPCGVEQR